MTFGEKVKAERTKLGMSQDELAAKIGVTRRIIGSYENDKSRGSRTFTIVLVRDHALHVMSTGYYFIYMWLFAWIYQGSIPVTSLLALLSAIPAATVVSFLVSNS